MIKYYSVNGQILPKEEAVLGITDLAILRGFGIFDYFVIKQGQPLFFDDYLDRMENSAGAFRLTLPMTRAELEQHIRDLVKINGVKDAGMKLLLTGGYSDDGYAPATPNMLLLESAAPVYSEAHFAEGIKLLLHGYHRTYPTVKSINYLVGVNMLPQTKAAGAEDVLFHHNGLVHETTRANFFIVKNNGTIVTAGSDILAGITRKKTLEIAQRHYKVELRDLLLDELITAKEAFITSSTKQVMPVVQVSDQVIGNGRPGPVSQHLLKLFRETEAEYLSVASVANPVV